MVTGSLSLPGEAQRPAEAEMSVGGPDGLDDGLELRRRLGELPIKPGAPERLANRAFSGARRATSASGTVASPKLPSSSSSTPCR